ncbi:MAG: MGMT family protein [Candidatus Harrisonbacteria bacterium]|nr:MGMT family protein [Candidatus Harrisonbacteria bacterium]
METEFQRKIWAVVKNIPKGETLSYKEVAELAGRPGAYRAVGNIVSKNYDPSIPCHRVIRANGQTGGYNRGRKRKREILEKERSNEAVY